MTRSSHAFAEAVYAVVSTIPRGQVASYAQVGTVLGSPRLARAVGNALKHLPRDRARVVPWQRVIRSDGTVAVRGDHTRAPRQVKLLRDEGVAVDENWRVPMEIYGWAGPGKHDATEEFPAPPPERVAAGRRRRA